MHRSAAPAATLLPLGGDGGEEMPFVSPAISFPALATSGSAGVEVPVCFCPADCCKVKCAYSWDLHGAISRYERAEKLPVSFRC